MQALLGIPVFIGLAWILSENRQKNPWRLILTCLALQLLFASIFQLEWIQLGLSAVNTAVMTLTDATRAGSSFVFGYVGGAGAPFDVKAPGNMTIIAFQILPIIVVMSAISSLLFYYGILQKLVQAMSWLLQRVIGVGGPTGLAVASSVFLGIIESPLFIKPYLQSMSRSAIFTMITAGMATVAGTVIVLYAGFVDQIVDNALSQMLIASMMSAPAAILFAQLMIPPQDNDAQESANHILSSEEDSALEAIVNGTKDGVDMCIGICGILLVLFAFIYLINLVLGATLGDGFTIQYLGSLFFYPFCWLMGVPQSDLAAASELMSTKTFLNELVAYSQMSNYELSEKSRMILTYAMNGFANFGSVGILIGGLGAMIPDRKKEVIDLSLKAMISGTLATMTTGAMIGFIS